MYEAGIQFRQPLDSRQEHAGMTIVSVRHARVYKAGIHFRQPLDSR
jgi:hypothetical protein